MEIPAARSPVEAGLDDGQPSAFRCEIPIRWSDQDRNGHVNNARVVTLMEEARILWLNQHAVTEGVESFAGPKFIAALNVEYLIPVSHGPVLMMELTISRIGTRSFTMAYEGLQDTHSVFRGSTVVVPIDITAGKPRALNETEIAYLSKYAAGNGKAD